jgi:L-rhamnose mutarotase
MSNKSVFRLKDMLVAEGDLLRNKRALYEAIKNANPACKFDGNGKILSGDYLSYRKLVRFLNLGADEDFTFSISELRALDRFFTLKKKSLCNLPIFYSSKNLLDYFSENNEITFAMSTRYQRMARTEMISRWDLRAMLLVLNKVKSEKIKTEIADIFHHGSNFDEIENEKWTDIFNKRRSSILSYGSPFANHATERILAMAFYVKPYVLHEVNSGKRLPLYFFWPDIRERQGVSSSAFLLGRRETNKLFGKNSQLAQALDGQERAIIVGDRCYASEQVGRSFGLFIAQRRNNANCIYAAIIGTYGPDTFAVAECLAEENIIGELPLYDGRRKCQPVYIAVVETRIEHNKRKKGVNRETRISSSTPRVLDSSLWKFNEKEEAWQAQ